MLGMLLFASCSGSVGGDDAGSVVPDVGAGSNELDVSESELDSDDPAAGVGIAAQPTEPAEDGAVDPVGPLVDGAAAYVVDGGRLVAPGLVVVVLKESAGPVDAVAVSLAEDFGGLVIGADPGMGVAQIQFVDEPDELLVDLLELVNADERVVVAGLSTVYPNPVDQAVPQDWSDPFWIDKDVSWTFEMSGVDDLWAAGYESADNVGVLIADYGIYDDHPDLDFVEPVGTRFGETAEQRLANNPARAHGSHVAGIACASLNGNGSVGVAPGCDLYGLDLVSGKDGMTFASVETVVGLLDATVASRPAIRVVNMSWALGPHRSNNCEQKIDPVTMQLFNRLFAKHPDVVWVAGAGNCGLEIPVLGADDLLEHALVPFPAGAAALHDNVVAVASLDEDFGLAATTSFGPGVQAAAPGGVSVDGEGVWAPIHSCDDSGCTSDWGSKSGTSMAAPHFAGLIALMFGANPELSSTNAVNCGASAWSQAVDASSAMDCALLQTGMNFRPLEAVAYTRWGDWERVSALPGRRACTVRLSWAIPYVPDAVMYRATITKSDSLDFGQAGPAETHQGFFFNHGAGIYGRLNDPGTFSSLTQQDLVTGFDDPDWSGPFEFNTNRALEVPDDGWLSVSLAAAGQEPCPEDPGANKTQIITDFRPQYEPFAVANAGYYQWVPPALAKDNAMVEFEGIQNGDVCEWIEWWSFPQDAVTRGAQFRVFANNSDREPRDIPVDQNNVYTLDDEYGQAPVLIRQGGGAGRSGTQPVTPGLFEPYNTPGRVGFARTAVTGAPGVACSHYAYLSSQSVHIELAERPLQPHCQPLADPEQSIEFDDADWPNPYVTCYWTE